MSDFADGLRGHIRVWANTSAIVQFLPQDLASFLGAHPLVRISLQESLGTKITAALKLGEADIGIFAGNVIAEGIDRFPYRQDSLVVLVPAGHILSSRHEVEFLETLDFDFVGLNEGSSLLQLMTDAAASHDRTVRLRIQVSSFDGVCRMIEAGLGIGILPVGAVRHETLGAGLQAISLKDNWAKRELWLGVRSGVVLQPDTSNLLMHLRQKEGH
ncbi:MAG: LysR substrate-binding domain-containing protein [Vogesella sp.]|uniref:LysR substrate-binding domain-containing protein n=1 Tax=Vogesella sp. TaxID=1904252 RepID=UPI00391B9F2C